MKIPKSIKKMDTIGVCAPSSGIIDNFKLKRLNSAIKNFNELGYKIVESKSVRCDINGQSTDAKTRAKEFMDMYLSNNIDAIICAAGGDFLVEMLPYIDFNKIANSNAKWVQGFSDITGLIFSLTTMCDIATIYGPNFGMFGMIPMYKDLTNSIKFLEGKDFIQNSFEKYQDGYMSFENNERFEYNLNKNVEWTNLLGGANVQIEGRLIGGCLDVLLNIVGTKYDRVKEYIERYKYDGILWYLESCELTGEQIIRGLFELKEAGWFNYTKGFVFGRYGVYSSANGINYYDAIKRQLQDINVPIIADVDIGHKSPQLTIANGLKARISSKDGKGIVYYI